MELEDIVEVTEGRRTKANLYLEHGYRLLAVIVTSEEDKGRQTGSTSSGAPRQWTIGSHRSGSHRKSARVSCQTQNL